MAFRFSATLHCLLILLRQCRKVTLHRDRNREIFDPLNQIKLSMKLASSTEGRSIPHAPAPVTFFPMTHQGVSE